MYKKPIFENGTIDCNDSSIGERLETKINRIVNNKEPITEGAEMIYSDREEGVLQDTDPRTDRWDIAIEGMDKVARSTEAKRTSKIEERKNAGKEHKEELGGTQDVHDTSR